MSNDDTQVREAFEAWLSHPDSPVWGILTKDDEGRYLEDDTHFAWVGWKAASRSLHANGYTVAAPKCETCAGFRFIGGGYGDIGQPCPTCSGTGKR